MKKLYSGGEWKERSRRRQLDEETRRRRRNEYLKTKHRKYAGLPAEPHRYPTASYETIQLVAPDHFSFVYNTEEMLDFFHRMTNAFKDRKNVFLDLSHAKTLTSDSIAVLLSIISNDRLRLGMNVGGNEPKDAKLREVLAQSGFYRFVRTHQVHATEDQGSISKRKSKKVEPLTVKELIRFATVRTFGTGKKAPGIYRTLIECMNNTRNHASRASRRHETWWATVYCDPVNGRATFTFVDNGIGIFRSVRIRGIIRRLNSLLGVVHNGDLLRDILEGKIESRTNLPYRGKGLPGMYADLNRGLITNLRIVSNDVNGDVASGTYRTMSRSFRGTVVYWEMEV